VARFQDSARWLAIAAIAWLLVWQSGSLALGAAFFWSLLVLAVFAAAVFATMFLLAPDGWRHIGRHPDLLVPLGLLAAGLALIDWLSGGANWLRDTLFSVPLGYVKAPVSLAWLLRILLSALFATWMTVLVVEAVRRDQADLHATLSQSKRRFLRVLLLLCLGWGLSTLLFAVELAAVSTLGMGTAHVFGRAGGIVPWLLLIGVLAYRFLLSLATAAVLPVAVESDQGFFSALRSGIAQSWRYRARWWKLLLVQYFLMGAWAVVHYRYSQTGGSLSSSTKFDFSFRYFAPWLAGYEYKAQWYSQAMNWLGHEPLVLVVTLSALLSGLLSIVVKLAIVQRYTSEPPGAQPADRQPRDPALAETLPGSRREVPTPAGPSKLSEFSSLQS
jgi:hypothetical protein